MRKQKWITICGLSILMVAYQNCSGYSEFGEGTQVSEAAMLRHKANSVLQARCVQCHNSETASGGVDITNEQSLLFLRHVVPGEPQLSTLFIAIQEGSMPPGDPLNPTEAQSVSDWIQSGFVQ